VIAILAEMLYAGGSLKSVEHEDGSEDIEATLIDSSGGTLTLTGTLVADE
jgi:hypothetical protein